MFTFSDLINEVKARVTLDKSGTEFSTTIKNTLNTSLFRVARERNWRVLRQSQTFDTQAGYSVGTGAVSVTNNSENVTVTGATFLTNSIEVGQRIKLGGSNLRYIIKQITGETTLVLDTKYDGTTSTTQTYEIYGKETYNVPIQAGRIYALWHEDFGYPCLMSPISDLQFYSFVNNLTDTDTPICWRQWGVDSVLSQPKSDGVLSVSSSSSSDTSINITIYGRVSGYPDYETIATNASDGTTPVNTTKSFDAGSIERIIKESISVGRITTTSDSANTTVAVLPAGDRQAGINYVKIHVYPFPDRVFPIHALYYKDPARMVLDRDVHELGHQFDEAILLLACAKLSYTQSRSMGDKYFALYIDEIKNLAKNNVDTVLNHFRRLRSPARSVKSGNGHILYSQLGGMYGPRA